jgi:hypothetical protein
MPMYAEYSISVPNLELMNSLYSSCKSRYRPKASYQKRMEQSANSKCLENSKHDDVVKMQLDLTGLNDTVQIRT